MPRTHTKGKRRRQGHSVAPVRYRKSLPYSGGPSPSPAPCSDTPSSASSVSSATRRSRTTPPLNTPSAARRTAAPSSELRSSPRRASRANAAATVTPLGRFSMRAPSEPTPSVLTGADSNPPDSETLPLDSNPLDSTSELSGSETGSETESPHGSPSPRGYIEATQRAQTLEELHGDNEEEDDDSELNDPINPTYEGDDDISIQEFCEKVR